ncbi:putative HECT E3 ubiquitin ligase [Planoprotostelium fungivorum]|uniref:Putative HECT E3 ubiquitin ligase n=1 Tax=Planoprotostelium fungivorum TaxID=1890364 RepID=A0A2P6NT83_9EUKA|nr:putative HECT E3 ubiquitin ligase [Planoprotostelium fungivorum]
MGNAESVAKPYRPEQLQQLEQVDNNNIALLKSNHDNAAFIQKALNILQQNPRQYVYDDECFTTSQSDRDKRRHVEVALSCLDKDEHGFLTRDIKYKLRAIRKMSTPLPFHDVTKEVTYHATIQKIFDSLIRRRRRRALHPRDEGSDNQRKADYVMSIFSKVSEPTLDIVLMELNGLPHIDELCLFDDRAEETSMTGSLFEEMEIEDTAHREGEPQEQGTNQGSLPEQREAREDLIDRLLSWSLEDSKKKLDATTAEISEVEVNPSPTLTLLRHIQRCLFVDLAAEDTNEIYREKLSRWIHQLVTSSNQLIDHALLKNDLLAPEAGGTKNVNGNIEKVLRNSMVNELLCDLFLCMPPLFSRNSLSSDVITFARPVLHLLQRLDRLNRFISENVAMDKTFLDLQLANSRSRDPESGSGDEVYVIETAHHYSPNTVDDRHVIVPGASHLCLTFDPRCSTEANQDLLVVTDSKGEPVTRPLSGKPETWPRGPIVVAGDSLSFHFQANGFSTYWGYRCTVSPVFLWTLDPTNGNAFGWLYDREVSASFLLRTCLEQSMKVVKDREETDNEAWLDSPLFRGGLAPQSPHEGTTFVQEFTSGKKDSSARQLIDRIEKKLPHINPVVNKMGGEPIDIAVRSYIITLIKHSGLLPSILSGSITASEEETLCRLFLEGRKLRQWVAAERRERFQRQEENNNNNAEAAPEDNSYEKFGRDILEKTDLLLQLTTCISPPEEDNRSHAVSNLSGKKRQFNNLNPGLRSSMDDPSIQAWIEMFSTWKKLQGPTRVNPSPSGGKTVTEIITALIKGSDVKTLRKLVEKRMSRAKARITVCKLLIESIFGQDSSSNHSAITMTTIRADLISVIGPSVRKMKEKESRGHYASGLRSSGNSLENSTKEAFQQLYTRLVRLLRDSNTLATLSLAAIDALSINWNNNEDYDILLKVFPVLRNLFLDDMSAVSNSAYKLYHVLCMQCLSASPDQSVDHPIQKYILENVTRDFIDSSETFRKLSASSDPKDFFQAEDQLWNTMLLLHKINLSIKDYVCSEGGKIVRISLNSPRYLPAMSPKLLPESFSLDEKTEGFVESILQRIGQHAAIQDTTPSTTSPEVIRFNGHSAATITGELISFLRFFLRANEEWSAHVRDCTSALLEACDLSPSTTSHSTLAALQVMGGDNFSAGRSGGRVRVKATREEGTMIHYDRTSTRCLIILDSSASKIASCDPDKLEAITEISLEKGVFKLTHGISSTFQRLMERLRVKKEEKKEREEVKKEESQWACEICTLFNEPHSTVCSMCGTRRTKEESSQEVSMDIAEETQHQREDLFIVQLRSSCMRALDVLLEDRENARIFMQAGGVESMMKLSSQPTPLQEFKTVEQLQSLEDRLVQLFYERSRNISTDHSGGRRQNQCDMISHSPFAGLPINLPTLLHRSSSKRLLFPDEDGRVIVKDPNDHSGTGLARANCVIPNSIPSFYFEITLMEKGTGREMLKSSSGSKMEIDDDDSGITCIAIGLYREGTELEGLPGNDNSFALQSDGKLCHNVNSLRASRIVERDFIEKFTTGDTMGCGWDIKTGRLWFTKNGRFLGNGFDEVHGRFYPVVWLDSPDTKIKINFGNDAFTYDYASTVSTEYMESVVERGKIANTMSAAELRRRAMAEDLMMMMDIFPLEVCIVALEKNKDDPNYAAGWLIENGMKELERMSDEMIARSERESREREEKEMMEAIMREQKLLGQFQEEQLPEAQNSPNEEGDYQLENREASRLLDDEMGAETPVQIDRRQHEDTPSQEEWRIEDVSPGTLIRIDTSDNLNVPIWLNGKTLEGRTGISRRVDVSGTRIYVEVNDLERNYVYSIWVPFSRLRKPTGLWQDPCNHLQTGKLIESDKLTEELLRVETSLTILQARRSVLRLITSWEDFPFRQLCEHSMDTVTQLLRLAAAENLTSTNDRSVDITTFNTKVMEAFKMKLTTLASESGELGGNLIEILTNECIAHLKRAVECPPPVLLEESSHPYENNVDIRKELHIRGASKLVIRFDGQSNLHRSDIMTRCSFYRDPNYQDLIVSFKGNQFNTTLINSDRVYMRFTSGYGERFWGYRFWVLPLSLRLNDEQAINHQNFELGYWLLELLLEHSTHSLRLSDLYTALVYYVTNTKRSARARGIQLLLRLLRVFTEKSSENSSVLDLKQLEDMRDYMEERYTRESKEQGVLYSTMLQSLVELLTVVRLAQNQKKSDVEETSRNLTEYLGARKLKLNRVTLYNGEHKRKSVDITSEMQKVVDEQYGSVMLVIPTHHSMSPVIAMSESTLGGLSENHIIEISYQYVDSAGKVTQNKTVSAKQGEALEIEEESWFEHMVNVAENIQSIHSTGSFTPSLCTEAYYMTRFFRKHHWPIVNEIALFPEIGISVPPPSTHYPLENFSLSFSLLLSLGGQQGRNKLILCKGRSIERASPAVTLHSEENHIVFQLSTTHRLESVTSSTPIPLKTWTHVTCVYDSDSMNIYIDGKLEGTRKVKGRVIYNEHPFFVGRLPTEMNSEAVSQGMEGMVKDMNLHYRSLNANEIKQLCEQGTTQEESSMAIVKKDMQVLERQTPAWNGRSDAELAEMVSKLVESTGFDSFEVTADKLLTLLLNTDNGRSIAARYNKLLHGVSSEFLQWRYHVLLLFNLKLRSVLSIIDFGQSEFRWSISHSLGRLRTYIMRETKMALWNEIISSTNTSRHRPSVNINRPRALKAREKGDPEGSKSVFGQLYRQLHFVPPSQLRRLGQIWTVEYSGEGGTDAGGLFRDCISHICIDLHSNHVPLFIPCPNAKGFGDNQEKFVPNPGATSTLQLSMFSFVGKLMGVAMRAKHVLNLDLPSIVWKYLAGYSHGKSDTSGVIDLSDVESIDALSVKMMQELMNAKPEEHDEGTLLEDLIDLEFVTTSTDGREVELIPSGSEVKVTWENREKFIQLLSEYKMREFEEQMKAMRRGLATIVPQSLMSLFTWNELELSVCGKREVNLQLLRENTNYSGYSPDDPHVHMFWEVMESFSNEERQMLLRFVWGRSRLPLTSADFEQKFVVLTTSHNSDTTLPVSHTCFFQLKLPRYSSVKVMRSKLLYAITEGTAIDTDHAAQDVNWDDEN